MAAFLQFYQTSISPLIRNGIPIIVVLGFWAALWRAGLGRKLWITGIATTAALVIWWMTIDQLARFGFDASFWAIARPLSFVLAITGLILLTRSKSIAAALDATPAWWLLAVQVYRLAGGLALLALWWSGRSVSALGLIAAVGDALVGLFAVIAAAWVYSGARSGRFAGVAWNVFGLSDIAFNVVNQAVLGVSVSYQVIMIAVFLAPLSVILHGLSLRQLSRAGQSESPSEALLAH